ncbi:hypothetical protein NBRC111894_600 [Sporolactobacillus inulinus]|uniref:Uncharacterized protein n=1 Tax=Sporolactobacillus inulinus TaxID=2078 RepID=A0A4Y1Z7X2_9BACL|nr:YslB family protein [Sporolactobacillus inulinus]GAY75046.1 hypothetical protein NBRC111894_600 [Sporolactobacillus inulinus]
MSSKSSTFLLAPDGDICSKSVNQKIKTTFECSSALVEARIKDFPNTDSFSLESGFIAEQIQHQTGCIAETYMEVKNGRQKKIVFQVKWDAKDPVRGNE